mgnify:CR=1 FL=1
MRTKETKTRNRGVTLIALVVTIVVLLILAGVAISMLSGDDGIIINAQKASEENDKGREKEIVTLAVGSALSSDEGYTIARDNLNSALANHIGTEGEDYTLSDTEPYIVTYLDSGRSYVIDEKGKVSEYTETDDDVDISEYVEIGQYVNYNPTVKDLSGTPVDESLTYISQTGDGQTHGNGSAPQTFTATATGTKWKVLSIENGTVTLISEDVIKTDAGGNFVLRGAPGYLYAEQELNEVCKIYGYGYGADKSQVTTYNYGGPKDGDLTGQITGSGARSITVEDINKYAGITEDENGILRFSDGTIIYNNYGSTTNPRANVYYPTITTPNGESTSAGVKNLKDTYYLYNDIKVASQVQDMLFTRNNYWLASRSVLTFSSSAYFNVRRVHSSYVNGDYLCYGFSSNLYENTRSIYAVRPLISLKSEVIDIDAGYDETTGWKLK